MKNRKAISTNIIFSQLIYSASMLFWILLEHKLALLIFTFAVILSSLSKDLFVLSIFPFTFINLFYDFPVLKAFSIVIP